jgi:hypothetical protein
MEPDLFNVWKEAVVAYCNVHFFGVQKTDAKKQNQDSRPPGRDVKSTNYEVPHYTEGGQRCVCWYHCAE